MRTATRLALLVMLAGCGQGPAVAPAQDSDITPVDRYLDALVDWGFSGAVLIARGDSVLLARGYGYADPAENRLATADTRYDAASLAKQFTAAAVLKLTSEGTLDLDTPLGGVLEEVPADKAGITIRHLLSHTSGMPREVGEDFQQMTRQDFVALALGAPLRFQPGSGYSYSNAGYALLAAILEGRTDVPFHELMHDELFHPLNLDDTGFIGEPAPNHDMARSIGGSLDGQSPAEWVHTWNHRGSGGLVTTVGDLFAWTRHLEAGSVLPELVVESMETPGESGYGFGISVAESPTGGRRIGHAGLWYAFSSVLYRYPDDGDVTVVVLSNQASRNLQWANVVGRALEEALIANEPRHTPGDVVALEPAAFSALAGTYDHVGGESIEVLADGDVLRIHGDGPVTSAALTRPGVLDPTEYDRLAARARRMLLGFSAGEFATLDSVASTSRAERYRSLLPPIFEAREDSLGPLTDVRHTSTLAPWGPGDNRQTYAALQFERGVEGVRLDWSPTGELIGLANEDPPLPEFLTAFRPVGTDEFAAYHVETGVEVRVQFRSSGDSRGLVVPRPGLSPLELTSR